MVIFTKASLVDTVVKSSRGILQVLGVLEGLQTLNCKKEIDSSKQPGWEGCDVCNDGFEKYCDFRDMHHMYCICIQV